MGFLRIFTFPNLEESSTAHISAMNDNFRHYKQLSSKNLLIKKYLLQKLDYSIIRLVQDVNLAIMLSTGRSTKMLTVSYLTMGYLHPSQITNPALHQ